jgi:exonuclease III
VCGWTSNNNKLQEALIIKTDVDILSVNETHWTKGKLSIENYVTFEFNRQTQHKNAPKGSGGVAILVRNDVFNLYRVEVIDKCYDGILSVKFENIENGSSFMVCSCYLPYSFILCSSIIPDLSP